MNYLVVFDIRAVDFLTPNYVATGLIAVLTAAVFLVARKSLPGRSGVTFSYVVLGIACVWTAVTWISTYRGYHDASTAIDDGRAATVEGRVSNFVPMPAAGHAAEHFCVADRCFWYFDSDGSIGFHNTSTRGGPIKAGLPVRVTYIDDMIVKLEVGQR